MAKIVKDGFPETGCVIVSRENLFCAAFGHIDILDPFYSLDICAHKPNQPHCKSYFKEH